MQIVKMSASECASVSSVAALGVKIWGLNNRNFQDREKHGSIRKLSDNKNGGLVLQIPDKPPVFYN